jgi:hypothetical protein
LEKQKCIASQFHKVEVKNQGINRAMLLLKPAVGEISLCLFLADGLLVILEVSRFAATAHQSSSNLTWCPVVFSLCICISCMNT